MSGGSEALTLRSRYRFQFVEVSASLYHGRCRYFAARCIRQLGDPVTSKTRVLGSNGTENRLKKVMQPTFTAFRRSGFEPSSAMSRSDNPPPISRPDTQVMNIEISAAKTRIRQPERKTGHFLNTVFCSVAPQHPNGPKLDSH
jgi:hypothetical protein